MVVISSTFAEKVFWAILLLYRLVGDELHITHVVAFTNTPEEQKLVKIFSNLPHVTDFINNITAYFFGKFFYEDYLLNIFKCSSVD